jgi:DNA-binding phage protein
MEETECQAYLNQALEEEDYELAEKIRKQLENFR